MTEYPLSPQNGRLEGRIAMIVADGLDPDTSPDLPPVQGTADITASVQSLKMVAATPKKLVALPAPVRVGIDEDGDICFPVPGPGIETRKFVDLVATDGDLVNPTHFTYKIRFNLSYQGKAVPLKPFSFEVPAGQVINLADVQPVGESDGVQIIRGEKGDSGKSNYQVWLDAGYVGTEADFVEWTRSTVPGPAGEDGEDSTVPGPQGPVGKTPTLEMGNVYSLPYGSQPVVQFRGSDPYILDMGIPLPKDGADSTVPGPVGPAGINWQNVWDPARDYVNDDLVSYEGSLWFAAGDPDLGEVPSAESVHWNLFMMQGAQGPAGEDGADSTVPGPAGPAPTLLAGTVSSLPAGSLPTVSVTGSNPYSVHFGIPAGVQGPAGPANTLTVKSVVGLPAGSAPTVTITGASPNQEVTFGIPKGDKGDAGTFTAPTSVGSFTMAGGFDAGAQYTGHTSEVTVRKAMTLSGLTFKALDAATYTLFIDGVQVGSPITAAAGTNQKFTGFNVVVGVGTHEVSILSSVPARWRVSTEPNAVYTTTHVDFTVKYWLEQGGGYAPLYLFEVQVPSNGRLGNLDDVDKSVAPTNGQTLTYDASLSLWKPTTPATGGGSGGTSYGTASEVVGDLAGIGSNSLYSGATTTLTVRRPMRITKLTYFPRTAGTFTLYIDGVQVGTPVVIPNPNVDMVFSGLSVMLEAGDHTVSIKGETLKSVHYVASPSVTYVTENADFTIAGWQELGANAGLYYIPLKLDIVAAKAGKLGYLDDVATTAAANGQALIFDAAQGLWKPGSVSIPDTGWYKSNPMYSAPDGGYVVTRLRRVGQLVTMQTYVSMIVSAERYDFLTLPASAGLYPFASVEFAVAQTNVLYSVVDPWKKYVTQKMSIEAFANNDAVCRFWNRAKDAAQTTSRYETEHGWAVYHWHTLAPFPANGAINVPGFVADNNP